MKFHSKIGFLGFGNANAALAYWMPKHGADCKVWTTPAHPGALRNVRKNGGTLSALGKNIKGCEDYKVTEAIDLGDLIAFSDLLILAVPSGEAQEAYLKELQKHEEQLAEKPMFVIAGTSFTIRYLKRLNVEYIIESTSSPTASGLDGQKSVVNIKDMKGKMEVSCMQRCTEPGRHLPYKPLETLPPHIEGILKRCLNKIEIVTWIPAELAIDGIKTSLHGVPTAENLEGVADDDEAGAKDPSSVPDRGYFYRDWAFAALSQIKVLEKERLGLVKHVGLKRDQELVDVLNERYEGWDFNSLEDLFVAKICYNEQKLTPHHLKHRFVLEAYIGFHLQAAVGRFGDKPTPLTSGYIGKFDELATQRGLKPFGVHGANLAGYTPVELAEFGFAFPPAGPASKPDLPNGIAPVLNSSSSIEIKSFDDIDRFGDRSAPVVAMFSGGLDSSFAVSELKRLEFDVHAVTVNVGGEDDLDKTRKTAEDLGATFVHLDGMKLFLENVQQGINARARYLDNHIISSSLSRPAITQIAGDYAIKIGAKLLVHTANRSQNSLPRLNNGIRQSGYKGLYGSPYVYSVKSRSEKLRILRERGLQISVSGNKESHDGNAFCREFEDGAVADVTDIRPPPSAWLWTQNSKEYPEERFALSFQGGKVISVNDKGQDLAAALHYLNWEVGKFGLGRHEGLEEIGSSGSKVVEVRETPAGDIIYKALDILEMDVLGSGANILKQTLGLQWTQEAAEGRWGSQTHRMCGAAIAEIMKEVTGTVVFSVSSCGFTLRSVHAKNSNCVNDRDAWEKEQYLKEVEPLHALKA